MISKRLLSFLLAWALVLQVPLPAFAAIQGTDNVGDSTIADRGLTITQVPTIDCKYGILSTEDGTVLWSRLPDDHTAMASTTKMMTAIVALENASLTDVFTVSDNAASVGESSAELTTGMKLSLYDLLCALLVHSGNDAGVAIAEGVAGSESKFAIMMNEKAEALGLKNTHFTNPHGLDAKGHYSSAYDLSVTARYAMKNPTFREIVGKKKIKLKLNKLNYTFKSTNCLMNVWDECHGIKTGYTTEAGYCLVSCAMRDGVEMYAVSLGCENDADRFTDCYQLLDWGFDHYRSLKLAGADEVLADVPMSGYMNKTVKAGVAEDVNAYALDYDGDISVDVKTADLPDGVHEGDKVGSVTWRQGEKVIASVPLVAKESVGKPLALFNVLTSLARVFGVLIGQKFVAEGSLYAQTVAMQVNEDPKNGADLQTITKKIEKDMAAG